MVSKLTKEYKVRDPIYGFVKLDAQEMDIVNSSAFQRLRRIKQLALTDMVYPGASHTRFEHSLGVVQMATDMFDNIVSKKSNLERLHLMSDGLERIRKIIRLAALLHDIGHAPFSHTGEESMPLLPPDHPKYEPDGSKKYSHEDYSIEIIKHIYENLIENHKFGESLGIKVGDITALLGDESVRPTRTTILWKELLSGQLDADRADYLLRDSLHIGVNYGIYDRHRLVNCVTIGEAEESDCFLAIEEGGWHVAESLVIARYQMFSQVYFHPVRRAFDYHVGQATKEVLQSFKLNDDVFPKPTSQQNIIKYLEFDDWKMCGAFKNTYVFSSRQDLNTTLQ
ncbi:MAG: HD domain-containing protein [Nitrososphaerota archaeon]|jgi:HD superfamily phosphohydrolase|nr:HD domain-containing protein [Nitrososphaerota archaeon]